jgi:hypothetical protein
MMSSEMRRNALCLLALYVLCTLSLLYLCNQPFLSMVYDGDPRRYNVRPLPLRRNHVHTMRRTLPAVLLPVVLLLALAGCSSTPHVPQGRITTAAFQNERAASPAAREVAMYALMLLKTGYQFGGKNPAAGLDCSGLVTYVYREAVGMPLTGNAVSLAREGREVAIGQLRTGDLVLFNTLGQPFSHVGIYLGNGEFIHAPNSRSQVRVDKITNAYWSQRFEMARTLLD